MFSFDLTLYFNSIFIQTRYHPIHKLECISASTHAKFWGMFDHKKQDDETDDADTNMMVLMDRMSSKRRECKDCT
jgi:hypothetical protein